MRVLVGIQLIVGALLPAPAFAVDPLLQEQFDRAATAQTECFGRWEQNLAVSTDPIDLVAEAVLASCDEEMREFGRLAILKSRGLLTPGDVAATRQTAKKAIMRRLVVWRVASGRKTAEPSPAQRPEPKTREGKLARCDTLDAEWREWAQERGHVRAAQIDEHDDEMKECREAAQKLPQAFDYHAANP